MSFFTNYFSYVRDILAEMLKLSSAWIFYVSVKTPESVHRRLRESGTGEGKCAIFMTRFCKSCRSGTYMYKGGKTYTSGEKRIGGGCAA